MDTLKKAWEALKTSTTVQVVTGIVVAAGTVIVVCMLKGSGRTVVKK